MTPRRVAALLHRMRHPGARFRVESRGLDVVPAMTVDDWADELEAALADPEDAARPAVSAELRCSVFWANHNQCVRPVGHAEAHLTDGGFDWTTSGVAGADAVPRPVAEVTEQNATLGEMLENCHQARRELQAVITDLEQRIADLTAACAQTGARWRQAEDRVVELAADRDRERGLRETNWAYQQDLITRLEAERDTWKTLAAKLAGLSGDQLHEIAPEPAPTAYRDLPDWIEKRQA